MIRLAINFGPSTGNGELWDDTDERSEASESNGLDLPGYREMSNLQR